MLFLESDDTEVFKANRYKLFASNEKQIDNHTLRLHMLSSSMSVVCTYHCTLVKWLLEFLGIPRNKGVNFHGKFGLGIPNHNNSGSKNLEIPRNSKFIANRTWNS